MTKGNFLEVERSLGFLQLWMACDGDKGEILARGCTARTYYQRLADCRDFLGLDLKDPASVAAFFIAGMSNPGGNPFTHVLDLVETPSA